MLVIPALAFAQFPAPDSFQLFVHYITIDQSDWCDGQIVQGPAYCNLFSWQTPDTANTPATLTGYKIYKDDILFLSSVQTQVDTAGAFWGSFYVTAVYENPGGESDSSNVVVISELPIATEEIEKDNRISIGFDLSRQVLVIEGALFANALWVYNTLGMQVLSTKVVSNYQSLEGLAPGVYLVVVEDKFGGIYSKLIVMGLR